MILGDGMDAVRALVETRIAVDPEPIPSECFVALRAWLADGHDPSRVLRNELAQLRARLYARSQEARSAR